MQCLIDRPISSLLPNVFTGQVLAGEVEEPEQPVFICPASFGWIFLVVQAKLGLTVSVLRRLRSAGPVEAQHDRVHLVRCYEKNRDYTVTAERSVCQCLVG